MYRNSNGILQGKKNENSKTSQSDVINGSVIFRASMIQPTTKNNLFTAEIAKTKTFKDWRCMPCSTKIIADWRFFVVCGNKFFAVRDD